MPKATIYLKTLTADKTTGESGKDDVFMEIYVDDVFARRWPNNNGTVQMGNDAVREVDVAINVDYDSKVRFRLRERDSPDNDNASSTKEIGQATLDRHAAAHASMTFAGPTNAVYYQEYQIIVNPIPTLRILGIKCEKQTSDMDDGTSDGIAGVASTCAEAASDIIKKSPRPRAKAISKAFDVAGDVLEGVQKVKDWLGLIVEGKDEVFMTHYTPSMASTDIDARLFPKQNDPEPVYKMEAETTAIFEDLYHEYIRLPVDQEDVTVELREHDAWKRDVTVCTITVPRVTSDTDPRVNGPAVTEVGNSYLNRNDGKGGVYHICYAIGIDDWALPPNFEAQGCYPSSEDPWGEWVKLEGNPMGSVPVPLRRPDNRVEIFAAVPVEVGSSTISPCRYRFTDASSPWLSIGFVESNQERILAAPSVAIWPSGQKHLVCWRGEGSFFWHRRTCTSGWENAWSDQDRIGTYHAYFSLVASKEGRLDLFTASNEWSLLWRVYENGAWGAWTDLGGEFKKAPAAASWGPDRVDVVVRGNDDELWHRSYDGTTWTSWAKVGGGRMGSSPALASRGPGRLDCVALGPEGNLIHRVFANGAWSPWVETGYDGPTLYENPTVVALDGDALDVFGKSGMDLYRISLRPGT